MLSCTSQIEPVLVNVERVRPFWSTPDLCVGCLATLKAREAREAREARQDRSRMPERLRGWTWGHHLGQQGGEGWIEFRNRLEAAEKGESPALGITPWNRRAALTARDAPPNLSLGLIGPVGSGKTVLAAARANALMATGVEVAWLPELELWETARAEQQPGGRRLLRPWLDGARVLVIDDLGSVEKPTHWHRNLMEDLVGNWYNRKKPMIFTSNLTLPQIADLYGDRVGSRIQEMLGRGLSGLHLLGGPNSVNWRTDEAYVSPPDPVKAGKQPKNDARKRAGNDNGEGE